MPPTTTPTPTTTTTTTTITAEETAAATSYISRRGASVGLALGVGKGQFKKAFAHAQALFDGRSARTVCAEPVAGLPCLAHRKRHFVRFVRASAAAHMLLPSPGTTSMRIPGFCETDVYATVMEEAETADEWWCYVQTTQKVDLQLLCRFLKAQRGLAPPEQWVAFTDALPAAYHYERGAMKRAQFTQLQHFRMAMQCIRDGVSWGAIIAAQDEARAKAVGRPAPPQRKRKPRQPKRPAAPLLSASSASASSAPASAEVPMPAIVVLDNDNDDVYDVYGNNNDEDYDGGEERWRIVEEEHDD